MSNVKYKYEVDASSLNLSKRLMCVEYPGLVNNVDKMIQTLGGLNNIGIVNCTKNRRMELRFRPNDIYCKPTCGDKILTTSLLLKIKVKKKFREADAPCSSKTADAPQSITFTTSIIGVVDSVYKFNNICDFQYLPLALKKDEPPGGKLEYLYDKLKPNFIPDSSWLEEDNVPLFLTPPVFSRFDTVHYYNSQKAKSTHPYMHSRVIGRTRKVRKGYAMFISFKDESVPQKPKADSLKMLHIKFLNKGPFDVIKQAFEERPIWSKNALLFKTNFSKDQLKYLLPAVAYYFITGPWRVMWVRYGYDPRIDFSAKIFQTFDFRLKTFGGLKSRVKAKRSYSNCLLPYKNSNTSRPKFPVITRQTFAKAYQETMETENKEALDENLYIFRPGMIPPFRQMFYQYCDIQVPEIQHMLAEMPMDPLKEKADPRCGWLPREFDAICREVISNLVNAEMKRQVHEQQRLKRKKEQQDAEMDDEDDAKDSEFLPEDVLDKLEIEISDSEDSENEYILETDSESDTMDSDIESDLKE